MSWISRRTFLSKRAAQRYAQATGLTDTIAKANLRSAVLANYGKHNAFAQIREWYIDRAEREMTPLEKKKHKMKHRLEKMQEDFE